jgi:hypothetical protein
MYRTHGTKALDKYLSTVFVKIELNHNLSPDLFESITSNVTVQSLSWISYTRTKQANDQPKHQVFIDRGSIHSRASRISAHSPTQPFCRGIESSLT